MDKSDRPLEKLLKSKTSDYCFYSEEGHLEGEWLWHRDVLLLFESKTPKVKPFLKEFPAVPMNMDGGKRIG